MSLVVPDHGCGREVLGRGYGLHTSTGPNFMLFGVYAGIIRVEYG